MPEVRFLHHSGEESCGADSSGDCSGVAMVSRLIKQPTDCPCPALPWSPTLDCSNPAELLIPVSCGSSSQPCAPSPTLLSSLC